MCRLHLGIPILIVVIFLLRYSRLSGPRHRRANPRPACRHHIDDLQAEYRPVEKPDVDIIAVHGLGSDADWSWTWQRKGAEPVEWLKAPDMLPAQVTKARILRYNYHSRWDANAPDTCLEACGQMLIRRLHQFRADNKDRPLIFIGHSLGGLVIQYGLLWADTEPDYRYFTRYTVGCVFLGCPFLGSKMQTLARVAAFFMSAAGSRIGIIEKISYQNDDLFHKLTAFCAFTRRSGMPVSCFYETYRTDYGAKIGIPFILVGMVVDKISASVQPGKILPLDTDHLNLNKFCGPHDRSFVDVAAEIVEIYRAMGNLLDWRRTRGHTQHLIIPFGRNECFVGREGIVEQLLQRIRPDAERDTCQRTVLVGLGGVGKTQIAIEAVYQFHHRDPHCSIFWVWALTPDTFEAAYREIGQKLQVIDNDGADVKALVKEALEKEETGRWLLVVDNADDKNLLFRGPSLAKYLPDNRNGSILFTTRSLHVVEDLRPALPIQVGPMNKSEASQLLVSGSLDSTLVEVANANSTDERVEVANGSSTDEILGLLTNLPLAIRQASDYLNKYALLPSAYLELYHSSEDLKTYLLSHEFNAHGRYVGVENPIIKTYFASFCQIRELDSLAVDYLRLMSFLAYRNIHHEILPSGSDPLGPVEAIGNLMAYTFVNRRKIGQFVYYDFHRLVQISARAWMRENDSNGGGEWGEFSERALTRLEKLLAVLDHARQDAWENCLAHAQSAIKYQLESAHERATALVRKVEEQLAESPSGGGRAKERA